LQKVGHDLLGEYQKRRQSILELTLFDFDTIYIDTTDGVIKLTIENIEECKYQPYKVTFVNKLDIYVDPTYGKIYFLFL
jgi:hypothetical protein